MMICLRKIDKFGEELEKRIFAMKIKLCMIYREVLAKRLERKRKQFMELERQINSEGVSSSVDKRKYIELKAIVNELENCLDMADSMFKFSKEEKGE